MTIQEKVKEIGKFEKADMNKYERACKTFLQGCSNSTKKDLTGCENCVNIFLEYIQKLGKEENFSLQYSYCLKDAVEIEEEKKKFSECEKTILVDTTAVIDSFKKEKVKSWKY